MTGKTRLAMAIAMTLATTPALATNGDHLIGLGAQSRALGGTGIAAYYGAESALVNPALLAKAKANEFTFAGTIFKPNVKVSQANSAPSNPLLHTSDTSSADMSVIPEVAIVNPISEHWTFGIGIFGTAGMGVDYRDNAALNNARTNLQLMKFAPSLAYHEDNWGIGASLAVMYGSLDISYKCNGRYNGATLVDPYACPNATGGLSSQQGGTGGVSDDYGLGWQIGGYLDVTPDVTVAFNYQSPISMKYKGQIYSAAQDFGVSHLITSDKLEQPATVGIGVNWKVDRYEIALDAKQIKWGSATGYKDFGWEDQNVYGLGIRYHGDGYWLGLGYNYGSNPIKKNPTGTQADYSLNRLNYLMFPGIVERHFTVGGGYRFSKGFSIDFAATYAPEVTETVRNAYAADVTNDGAVDAQGVFDLTTKHSQTSYTLSLRYDF